MSLTCTFTALFSITAFSMNEFYFLQEAIVGGPIMILLLVIAVVALIISAIIVYSAINRIKKESSEYSNRKDKEIVSNNIIEDYKKGILKPDGSFIVINFSIAIILIIISLFVFYKISTITFD